MKTDIKKLTEKSTLLAQKKAKIDTELAKISKEIEQAKKANDITNRVKTYKDVCKILKIHPVKSLPYQGPTDEQQEFINSIFVVSNIVNVLNEGWSPNIQDTGENKYYPYFRVGSGFVCYYCLCDLTRAFCPSRLLFKSSELAVYAGKTFLKEYKRIMM